MLSKVDLTNIKRKVVPLVNSVDPVIGNVESLHCNVVIANVKGNVVLAINVMLNLTKRCCAHIVKKRLILSY